MFVDEFDARFCVISSILCVFCYYLRRYEFLQTCLSVMINNFCPNVNFPSCLTHVVSLTPAPCPSNPGPVANTPPPPLPAPFLRQSAARRHAGLSLRQLWGRPAIPGQPSGGGSGGSQLPPVHGSLHAAEEGDHRQYLGRSRWYVRGMVRDWLVIGSGKVEDQLESLGWVGNV